MTMVWRWNYELERPVFLQKICLHVRVMYCLCIVASACSIFIVAFATSFTVQRGHIPQYPIARSSHRGNNTERTSMRIGEYSNGDDISVGLNRTIGRLRKGGFHLRWNGNRSGSMTSEHRDIQTAAIDRRLFVSTKVDCTGNNQPSDFILPELKYLPTYKNPCWYEDMVKPNVYDGNKFSQMQRYFNTLKEEWTKKMNTDAQPKRLRCLPYFFLAGQPKCGSTDLYDKLMSHPDIAIPPCKEPHWWAKKRFARIGESGHPQIPFRDYIDMYDKTALLIQHPENRSTSTQNESEHRQLITGDSSVSTLWFNDYWYELPENCGESEPKFTNAHFVKQLLPNSRIIVILREPVERLYSDYLYFQTKDKSPDNFHIQVRIAIDSFNYCMNTRTLRSCVYDRTVAGTSKARLRIGMYYVFLQEWLRIFPRNQVHVIRLEDYALLPLEYLRQVFRFLGLRDLSKLEEEQIILKSNVKRNSRRSRDTELGDMRSDTRAILKSFYLSYNQKLSILLHDSKFLWTS